MSDHRFRKWSSAVERRVKLRRISNYPRKLKIVVGDPRTRFGTFYTDLDALSQRYSAAGNLTVSEFRVFSQNGEDGVIAELVRRLGGRCPTSFVEFGMGNGRAGNCVFLADALGWEGLFIEPADDDFEVLQEKYAYSSKVRTLKSFVTPDNIDSIIEQSGLGEVGVMSIDVDGNDYYIWRSMRSRPSIVVIEYNGSLPLDRAMVQPFQDRPWDGTDFFGASLGALEELGVRKGYRFVHTELTGTNAFFVADEYAAEFDHIVEVPRRKANYEMLGFRHAPDDKARMYIDGAP